MMLKRGKYAKYCTLVGAHCVTAPLSFVWNFGNLSAYMESYFMFYCSPGCVDGDSQWILTLFIASGCPGLVLSGPVIKNLGITWAGVLAMILCNGAFLASAWTIQVSVIGTAVLMGLLNGMGAGTTVCAGFMYVNAWAIKNNGLLLATVSSAPTVLSIVQNQIITSYVNPENLKADARHGPKAYFSQPEILERVPKVILIVGFITLSLQIVGYLLVSMPPSPSIDPDKAHPKTKFDCQEKKRNGYEGKTDEHANGRGHNPNVHSVSHSGDSTKKPISNGNKHHSYQSNVHMEGNSDLALPAHAQEPDPETFHTDRPSHYNSEQQETKGLAEERFTHSFKPLDMLRTLSFKIFWLYNIAIVYGMVLKNNYYKQFGLLYIENDQFLTLVGSLIPVVASLARVTFGGLMDRGILTVKDCICISLSVNAVLCAFWFFIPQVSSIGYMFLILGLASIHSLIYTMAASGTLLMFGPKYFSSNFMMTYSSATAGAILSALIVSNLLRAAGWFWLFASCSVLSVCVLGVSAVTDFPMVKRKNS